MTVGYQILMILQRPTTSTSARKVVVSSWSDVARIRGVLKPASGTDRQVAEKMGINEVQTFVFDKPHGIVPTEKDRLRYGDKVFTILWLKDPNGRGTRFEATINYSEQANA